MSTRSVDADVWQTVGDDPGVTAPSNRPEPPTPRPLSNWTIAAGALVVLAVAAVVSFVLLRHYGGTQIQLDAIRTAGTLVVGTSRAVALLLTADFAGAQFAGGANFTDAQFADEADFIGAQVLPDDLRSR